MKRLALALVGTTALALAVTPLASASYDPGPIKGAHAICETVQGGDFGNTTIYRCTGADVLTPVGKYANGFKGTKAICTYAVGGNFNPETTSSTVNYRCDRR